jgi:hypothetical protein
MFQRGYPMKLLQDNSLRYVCLLRLLVYALGYALVFHSFLWRLTTGVLTTGTLSAEVYTGPLDESMMRLFLYLYLIYLPFTTWLLYRFKPLRRYFLIISFDVIILYVSYTIGSAMIQT